MKRKKLWIILGSVVVVLAAGFAYLNFRNRSLSPPGSATLTNGSLTVSITYSRPSVRGRLVFGTEEQKALQPYGKYWRLGANESTEITVNKDVSFNGSPLKAGTYRMYAVPGPENFEIVLNSELGKWGYMEPDYAMDVLRTKVPVEKITTPVEQYTIKLAEASGGIDVIFEWSDTRFAVPVR
jgi:hypothetical protein